MTRPAPWVLLAVALGAAPAFCQELLPRAYWPAPKGTKVFNLGYVYTDGDVVIDPSLPFDGVNTRTHAVSVAYSQVLNLAGRTASVTVALPAAATDIEADTGSDVLSGSISGLADLQVRLAINLLGAPTMTPQEFQQYRKTPPRNVLGTSLKIQVPIGEYNPSRQANIGTSRWAARPELGYVRLLGNRERWAAEVSAGVWIYGDNANFLGLTLEQQPLFAAEAHLVSRRSPGRWFSLDWNYYEGGRTTVGRLRKDNRQQNSRIGVTFVFPVKRHVWKVALSDSLTIREGGDYFGIMLGYAYVWN